jgi:putative membrane protein
MNLAEKLSARAGQGLGVGLLTARLGLKTISLMRPIPFPNEERPKLGSIRKSVLESLKSKLS